MQKAPADGHTPVPFAMLLQSALVQHVPAPMHAPLQVLPPEDACEHVPMSLQESVVQGSPSSAHGVPAGAGLTVSMVHWQVPDGRMAGPGVVDHGTDSVPSQEHSRVVVMQFDVVDGHGSPDVQMSARAGRGKRHRRAHASSTCLMRSL